MKEHKIGMEANMAANALVQTYIDQEIKEQATTVLERMGLTVSEALKILLTRTATEGALPFSLTSEPSAEYDAWFRAEVQRALDDTSPSIPHAEVRAEFSLLRAATRVKIQDVAE